MDEIKNRVNEALAIRGLKQVELSDMTGINKASINSYIKQRWQPKQEALYKMAKALDVSELWLAGYNVEMARPVAQKQLDRLAETISILKHNKRYYNLLDYIVKLDDDQLVIIESMVKQMVKE